MNLFIPFVRFLDPPLAQIKIKNVKLMKEKEAKFLPKIVLIEHFPNMNVMYLLYSE